MKGYYNSCLAFVREVDRNQVHPVRIKREWTARGYEITECEHVAWQDLYNPARNRHPAPEWDSNRMKPPTRAEIIASGVIRLPGDGMPCLMMQA